MKSKKYKFKTGKKNKYQKVFQQIEICPWCKERYSTDNYFKSKAGVHYAGYSNVVLSHRIFSSSLEKKHFVCYTCGCTFCTEYYPDRRIYEFNIGKIPVINILDDGKPAVVKLSSPLAIMWDGKNELEILDILLSLDRFAKAYTVSSNKSSVLVIKFRKCNYYMKKGDYLFPNIEKLMTRLEFIEQYEKDILDNYKEQTIFNENEEQSLLEVIYM